MSAQLKKFIILLQSEFKNLEDSEALNVLKTIRRNNFGKLRGLSLEKIFELAKPIVDNLAQQKRTNKDINTQKEEKVSPEKDEYEEEVHEKRRNKKVVTFASGFCIQTGYENPYEEYS